MSNLILVCHGGLNEFRSFELKKGQVVHYRGNFGAPINESSAARIVKTLLQDPMTTDKQFATELKNYQPSEPLTNGTFRPDIDFGGSEKPKCFVMNMTTRRRLDLGKGWTSRLSDLVRQLPQNFYLNLICCTDLGIDAAYSTVNNAVAVKSWNDVFG
ncbi:MAG TPA: hypothetical protein VF698_01645 [Thermoanaerobaculia bacterium]|jgi:hypothetical protein